MLEDIVNEKKRLRKEMYAIRNAVSSTQKKQWDESIRTQLEAILTERNVKVVHAYLPMGGEVD
ncbi:MAG: 5-formyltetrahydrofolate cyclo-ligase, partial [Salibacteraceae bacterium]